MVNSMHLVLARNQERNKLLVNAIMLVTLTSMIFIYPFDNQFRFTLGVAVLSTLLLYFARLSVLTTAILSGIAIVILRTAANFALGDDSFEEVVFKNLPSLAYYLSFGICFHVFRVRKCIDNLPVAILLISLADITSNLVEIYLRPLNVADSEAILGSIIAVAVLRAIVAVYWYALLCRYHAFVLEEEQRARYAELTMMIAKLRAEVFYLRKSSQDIEQVMEQSYWLYDHLQNSGAAPADHASSAAKALAIARDIHEIKKVYVRVIAGIEKILKSSTTDNAMKLSEILFIIQQNTQRYLAEMGSSISITFAYGEDFLTDKHYTIVSVLDNLIINAIEACGQTGAIRVAQTSADGHIVFRVEDTGCGIHPQNFALIFNPGFSTKFSPHTGKMSTGLGLAHVKNLTEALGGSISVSSQPGAGAVFVVTVPRSRLIINED